MPITSGEVVQIRSFTEPAQYQAAIRGGDGKYTQLGRGLFRADMTNVTLGRVKLQSVRETLSRLASTGMAADRVTIVIWPGNGLLPVVRGIQIRAGELMCHGPGMQSHHRTSGPIEFVSPTMKVSDFARPFMPLLVWHRPPRRNPS